MKPIQTAGDLHHYLTTNTHYLVNSVVESYGVKTNPGGNVVDERLDAIKQKLNSIPRDTPIADTFKILRELDPGEAAYTRHAGYSVPEARVGRLSNSKGILFWLGAASAVAGAFLPGLSLVSGVSFTLSAKTGDQHQAAQETRTQRAAVQASLLATIQGRMHGLGGPLEALAKEHGHEQP